MTVYDPDARERAIAQLEAEHPGCGPPVRRWLATEDMHDHQRAGTWTLAQVAAGTLTAANLIAPITALMLGVADDDVWLVSTNPAGWRQTMLDHLRQQVDQFLELVEPAHGDS
jgi:hypothetical protein